MAQSNSEASASESNSGVGFTESSDLFVDPSDSLHLLASACTYSSARGTCSSSAETLNWGGCTVDKGLAVLTGSVTETFSGTSSSSCVVPVVSGETVVRTSSGTTLTVASGATIKVDTNGGTAWDGTVIPSTGSSVTNSSGTRTIAVGGTHRQLTGPKGTILFDHFLKTTTPLTVTGTRAAGTRVITGGVMSLYHNRAKYTASTTFQNVAWTDSTCCYPTSGSLSTTFTGSLTGSTSMTFSSTCGEATHVDTSGVSTTVTLNQCQ